MTLSVISYEIFGISDPKNPHFDASFNFLSSSCAISIFELRQPYLNFGRSNQVARLTLQVNLGSLTSDDPTFDRLVKLPPEISAPDA